MPGKLPLCAIRLFVLATHVFALGCVQTSVTLVSRGQSDYTIVIAPDSPPPQRYAAEELQEVIEQISGAKPAVSESAVDGPMVFVGPSDALEAVLPGIDYDALGAEGLVMRTVGSHLVLTGGQPRGTLYAVYEFLHNELNCRWFTSGGATPPVTRIPRQKTITVGPLDETKTPALEYRSAWYGEAFDGDWAARNRLNGHNTRVTETHGGKVSYYRTQAWHTFKYFISPSAVAEQPEFFALNDGKRSASQLCTSHPVVVERATNTIRSWIRQDPKARFFSVIANDSGGFCSCELCGPLTEHERTRAALVLYLSNRVADSIRDEHPDVMIDTIAYSPTCPPTRHLRPRDNVMVRFATPQACRAHPLATNCGDSWHLAKFLRTWGERCPQLYVWDYLTNFTNYLQPFPNLHTLQPNIQLYLKHNVKGIFNQAPPSGGGGFGEMRAYLMARLMWESDCDFDAHMNDFLEAYYGPAAKPIRRYIDMLREKVETGLEPLAPIPTDVVCPASGKPMFQRHGEYSPILACDNFPDCKGELEVDGATGNVVLPPRPPMKTDLPCPDCGEALELRRNHYHGPWLLCSKYPDCLDRIGWSTLGENERADLERALAEHEKALPQLKVRIRDGTEYEAGGEALHVKGRPEGSSPWIRVHMFDRPDAPYLSRDIIDRAGELFDQAETAVADDPVLLKRVHKERLQIEVVKILRQEEFLPTSQEYERVVEQFAQIDKDWNFESIREGGSFDRRLGEWRAKVKALKEAEGTSENTETER